ncbi:MAG TPA: type IV secretory system conjugative DNA transfer family protein [Candidatus Faecousia intestinigallinarum]|nr:type IV secretory system conjugative DNA transfer family protein [Candidatus Faecousia intestinigallinarum]
MNDLKSLCRRATALIQRLLQQIDQKVSDYLPERTDRIYLYAIYTALSILLAYLVALVHIGIGSHTANIFTMIAMYAATGQSYPFLTFLLLDLILGAAIWFLAIRTQDEEGRGFLFSDSNVYGSARELSMEDLQQVADVLPIESLSGTILGQLDKTGKQVIGIPPNPIANKNLLAFGPPGAGKTFSIVNPLVVQAVRRRESVVLTESKGDGWAETCEYARLHGYIVKRYNLKDIEHTDGMDILGELRHDDLRSITFANIVMNNTGNSKDPHLSTEQSLLRACSLYIERNPNIPPQEKTFASVYNLILQGAESLDKIFQSTQYDPNLRIAYDSYAPFKGSENLRANVLGNLASRLQVLSSPAVRRMTAAKDIDLTLPGKKPCIYYVGMSDNHESMKFLGTLFFSFLFLDLYEYADSRMNRQCEVPVNIVLEEAANIGEIVGLTKFLSAARSRGISISLIFQDYGQLLSTYGEEAASTILTDCSIHACFGTNSQGTANIFEWETGESTVKVKTEQHDAMESPFRFLFRNSTGDGRRHVYTSNEIRRIKRGHILLGWQGYDTLMCHTFGINQHPEYKNGHMPVISPDTRIPLSNTEARDFLKAMEEQRVEDYNHWLQNGGNPWEGYEWPKPQYDGPSRHMPPPQVIPYPELERMALEYAEQAHPTSVTQAVRGAPSNNGMEQDAFQWEDDPDWQEAEQTAVESTLPGSTWDSIPPGDPLISADDSAPVQAFPQDTSDEDSSEQQGHQPPAITLDRPKRGAILDAPGSTKNQKKSGGAHLVGMQRHKPKP